MRKIIGLFCLCVVAVSLLLIGCEGKPQPQTFTSQQLYKRAIVDAMVADEDEMHPLINLTAKDKNTTVREDGKVLVGRWHRHYDTNCFCSLVGQDTVSGDGYMFLFSLKEIQNWFNSAGEIDDLTLRFEQLIGLPPNNGYTEFSFFYTDVADLIRPAYCTDVTTNDLSIKFCDHSKTDEGYKTWFNNNILGSYYSEWLYPWTRLGYTYDWADNGKEYGLSEFLAKPTSSLHVQSTYTNEQFFEYLKD